MSLQSWIEEFYPIPAKEVSKENALEHSIKKWEGLRKENLEKHDLMQEDRSILDQESYEALRIDGNSCALCVHYAARTSCIGCPLYHIRQDTKCDKSNKDVSAVYFDFTEDENPEPMIEELKQARNWK